MKELKFSGSHRHVINKTWGEPLIMLMGLLYVKRDLSDYACVLGGKNLQ